MALGIRCASLRVILNSGGGPAAEAELTLADGSVGRGSSPAAIKPGRRERATSVDLCVGSPVPNRITAIAGTLPEADIKSQATLDLWLEDRLADLGTDVTLALSLAYARASAQSASVPLFRYLAAEADTEPALPGLLAAVVSGGLHQVGRGPPFQQIMLAAGARTPSEDIPMILEAYRATESALRQHELLTGYSASSGMTVNATEPAVSLDAVSGVLDSLGLADVISIVIDVAAEHLWEDDGYRLGDAKVDADGLTAILGDLLDQYPISYVEDPFIAAHVSAWSALRRSHGGRVGLIGDDLYATNSAYLDPAIADGVLLKMNQVGTVSSTLRTASEASRLGMECWVSHRSLETEDTAVCDLAVAIGAGWIKVGGPRRGDRTAKYNRLLCLEDLIT
jgi:enolase